MTAAATAIKLARASNCDDTQRSAADLAGARETADLGKNSGLPVNVASGRSTGTRNIEHENGLTELEAGSYVFMKPDTP